MQCYYYASIYPRSTIVLPFSPSLQRGSYLLCFSLLEYNCPRSNANFFVHYSFSIANDLHR